MQAKIRYRRAPDPRDAWPMVMKRMVRRELDRRPTLTVVLLPSVTLAAVLAIVMLLPIYPPTSTAQTPPLPTARPTPATKPARLLVPPLPLPANRIPRPATMPTLDKPQRLFKSSSSSTTFTASRKAAPVVPAPSFAYVNRRRDTVQFLPHEQLYRPAASVPTVKTSARPAPVQPTAPVSKVQVLADSTQRYHRVAYLVDLSGSLVDAMPQVIAWLGNSLDSLEQPVSFTVIFFRHDAVVEVPPLGLKPGSFRAKYEVFNWMQLDHGHIRTGGKADLADAMIATMKYDLDEVFIVSDDGFGIDSRWGTDPDLLNRIAQIMPEQETRINTVQFYYRDPAGALEAIADRFGGTYTYEGGAHYPVPKFVEQYSELRATHLWP